MRFYCEWCYQRVEITDRAAPRAEVLGHFFRCSHRPPLATSAHIEGLATHIANLLGDSMEFVLKVRNSLAG